jgi:hypothetical protein
LKLKWSSKGRIHHAISEGNEYLVRMLHEWNGWRTDNHTRVVCDLLNVAAVCTEDENSQDTGSLWRFLPGMPSSPI